MEASTWLEAIDHDQPLMGLEAAAIRACLRWPELVSQLAERDFACPHLRAVFVVLVSGADLTVLIDDDATRRTMADRMLLDMSDVSRDHVQLLREHARCMRRRAALLVAADCAERGDDVGMRRAIAQALTDGC